VRKHLLPIAHAGAVVAGYALLYVAFFSPALFSGRLLAPGDAALLSLPHLYCRHGLWTPLLYSGFPVMADPQTFTWYPPALLLGLVPGSFNAFVLSAYVLASSFTYGLVLHRTGCRTAAAAAGLVFGMSGFFMGHLGHTNVIHSACWLPLLIWALDRLRDGPTPGWVAAGALAVGSSSLGGHPQFAVYTLGLGAAYALFLLCRPAAGRFRFACAGVAVLLLGLGSAGILLVPMLELMSLSIRARLTFEQFALPEFCLHARELPGLAFPYLYGGLWDPVTGHWHPYFGRSNFTEAVPYVGLLPLLLAAVGAGAARRDGRTWFWLATAVLALLLALGPETPLCRLSYHVPLHNKFRIPARHLMEFALAISILAGTGLAALARLERGSRLRTAAWGAAGLLVLLGACLALYRQFPGPGMFYHAAVPAWANVSVVPWRNPAVGIPLAAVAASLGGLCLWAGRRGPAAATVLLAGLVLDLAAFGWFREWQFQSPCPEALLNLPDRLQPYRDELRQSGQRLLPVRALGRDAAPANLSWLWGVPSARGYSPLTLTRYRDLVGAYYAGFAHFRALQGPSRALDLLAVRYVFLPAGVMTGGLASDHWHRLGQMDGVAVYENRQARPRAWLVGAVRSLPSSEDVVESIHRGRLSDGEPFDPARTALLDGPYPDPVGPPDSAATAEVVRAGDTRVEVHTHSAAPAFLVLSDVYYPGWRVRVNGVPAPLYRADHVLRGVAVPAGDCRVVFDFRPWSFYAGAALTGLSLAFLVGLVVTGQLRAACAGRRGRESR
jgi:hypothetical protein